MAREAAASRSSAGGRRRRRRSSGPPPAPSARPPAAVSVEGLEARIDECMLADRRRYRGRLRRAAAAPAALERLAAEIQASAALVAARRASVPPLRFADELPIVARRDELMRAIAAHQVVVVCGETGSGKSTQLPKLCLALGRGAAGAIGHTQPRRIAARAIAARIAAELGSPLGGTVGYRVRFDERSGPRTLVKVVTDGMLLAEIETDRRLERYDTLIVDEAHERSLNVDFLLGYLKQLLPRRPELKLIITSATIDPQRFARHFDGAPVIEVSGRTYPVEVRYRPPDETIGDDDDAAMQHLGTVLEEAMATGPGDILVFQPGEREIRETAAFLAKQRRVDLDIVPLYARLPAGEQQRIFAPHGGRRIVIATNVAETSLTVPGIRFVVDTGLARISRYSPGRKVQRLPVEPISRASADQRKGRCGRVASGVCFRLYAQTDLEGRPAYTDPEIRRASLAAAILRMESMRLGHVSEFPFVDAPQTKQVNDGYTLLQELGAIDAGRRLTELGRRLARLPVDPRLGRMLLAASELGCLDDVLIIASALSVQDPRVYPFESREAAQRQHARFASSGSDFLALLELWRCYHGWRRAHSRRRLGALCREQFLSLHRLVEWADLHRQLKQLVSSIGLRSNDGAADAVVIHRAVLTGLLGNVAVREEDGRYLGARGKRLAVFPGSALAGRTPRWIMAAELVETGRLYARTVAAVRPEWIERAAAAQLQRTYSEPHWDRRTGRVVAFEQVTLYGLVLVARRRTSYAAVDPAHAREIFIREALLPGALDTDGAFLAHNRALVEQISALEDRIRRRDLLADAEALFDFYDERLASGVCTTRGFESWRRRIEREEPRRLFVDRARLLQREPAELTAARFPDRLTIGAAVVELDYRFDPGSERDGVTARVPLALLNQLEQARFDRVVPALLREKLIALVKTLPKAVRRTLVPVPDHVDRLLPAVIADPRPVAEALSAALERLGVVVDARTWDEQALPAHLRMGLSVRGDDGEELAFGRDLRALQAELGERAQRSFERASPRRFERDGIRSWDFGDLPEHVEFEVAGVRTVGFPALVDCGASVAIRVRDVAARAGAETREGVRRLFMLALPEQSRYLRRKLPGIDRLCLYYVRLGPCAELRDDMVRAAQDRVLFPQGSVVRRQRDFERVRQTAAGVLAEVAAGLCALVGDILEARQRLLGRLAELDGEPWRPVRQEIEAQHEHLVYPGFVSATPVEWLPHLPRYLDAARRRVETLRRDPGRDRARAEAIAPLWRRYLDHGCDRSAAGADPALVRYRWLVEELRVSLFAQQLGTAEPVSITRLENQWRTIGDAASSAGDH